MNREQVKVLKAHGYTFTGVPGIVEQPKATYYSRNRNTGEIVKHHLPADPYSLQHYLRKGFVLDESQLPPQAKEGFACVVCGKEFSSRIALAGHSRTHRGDK